MSRKTYTPVFTNPVKAGHESEQEITRKVVDPIPPWMAGKAVSPEVRTQENQRLYDRYVRPLLAARAKCSGSGTIRIEDGRVVDPVRAGTL